MKNSQIKSRSVGTTPEGKTDREPKVASSVEKFSTKQPSYHSMKKAVRRISQDHSFAEIKDFYGVS